MSSDEREQSLDELEDSGIRVFSEINNTAPDVFSESFVREIMTCAVRLYSRRERQPGDCALFKPGEVTATDVARTVGPMLESVGLELFELSMWKGIGTP